MPAQSTSFANAQIAVIGTSVVRYAVPHRNQQSSLLGDGRNHTRLGIPRASITEINNALEQAIHDQVEVVFVESNPLLFAFNGQEERYECADYACHITQFSLIYRNLFKQRLLHLTGLQTDDQRRLSSAQNDLINWNPEMRRQRGNDGYPLVLFQNLPDPSFAELTGRAQDAGIEVVLLHMPRAPQAYALMGQEQRAQLTANTRQLAETLSLPLFAPRENWGAEYFVDRGHLNQQGRERFLLALRNWQAARQ